MSVERLVAIAEEYEVLPIANVVLADPRFPVWSGSSKPYQHHYGKGGLAQHTFEVVDLCLKNNDYFKDLGRGVSDKRLVLAAIFHDCGKMWDYEPISPVDWQDNNHKRIIYHISRSALVWHQALHAEGPKIGFTDEKDDVLHAILAHHGRREWGSPVSPSTRLAWLLHLCDCLSARIYDCETWDQVKDKL